MPDPDIAVTLDGGEEYDSFVKEIDGVLGHMERVDLGQPSPGLYVMDDSDVNALVKEAQLLLRAARGVAVSRRVTGRPATAEVDPALVR